MILIELEGGNAPRFRLEFHPRLTVVAGLEPSQRRELAKSLTAVLRGGSARMSVSVDVGGVAQDLTDELIHSLGLDQAELNNVVVVGDLPRDSDADVEEKRRPERANPAGENVALDEARRELDNAKTLVRDLEDRIQRAGTPPPDVSATDLQAAIAEHERAHQNTESVKARLQDMGIIKDELPPTEQLAKLKQVVASVEKRIGELKLALVGPAGDPEAIQRGREKASDADAIMRERSARIATLAQIAGEWTRVQQDLGRIKLQPRPPQWLIAQTKDELDEAGARVNALTYQMSEGIDVSASLLRAQRRLDDAQTAWDEIENGIQGQTVVLEEQRDELYRRVTRIFGDGIGYDDVLDALEREHRQTQDERHPAQDLVDALAADDIEATLGNALAKSDQWFEDHRNAAASYADNQRAMASALLDLRDLQAQVRDLEARLQEPAAPTFDFDEQRRELADATTAEARAAAHLDEVRLAHQRAAEYDLEALPALADKLGGARSAVAAAQRKFDYFRDLHGAGDERPVPKPVHHEDLFLAPVSSPQEESSEDNRPWWLGGRTAVGVFAETPDLLNVSDSAIEVYLLARVAAMRLAGRGESVPLIIDSIFEHMSQDVTLRILKALAKVSPFVQVIYLSGNDIADKWAKKQDIYTAATVRLELVSAG